MGRHASAVVSRISLTMLIAAGIVVSSSAPEADAAPPPPPTSVSLPLSGYTEAVMDDAHGHLFVTGYSALSWAGFNGGADSKVLVLNEDGSTSATFTGIDGAAGMYLDSASNQLYVAAYGASTIQVIDTATLTVGTSYDLGTEAACPYDVVKAGGYLWSTIGCGTNEGYLARTNTSTLNVKTYVVNGYQLLDTYGTMVFSAEIFASPSLIRAFDISSGTPTLTGTAGLSQDFNSVWDIAVMPDGSDILSSAGTDDAIEAWATSDLAFDTSYDTGDNPSSVTISPDGGWIVGAADEGVSVFQSGTSTPVNTFPWSEVGTVAPRGTAVESDMSTMYLVTGINNFGAGTPTLTLITDPTVPRSELTLVPENDTIQVTAVAQLSGTLTFTDGASSAGKTIHVTRTGPDATQTDLADVVTDTGGNFTVTDTPPAAGTYTYQVWFNGTAAHRGASATADVTAEKYTSKLSISSSANTVTFGSAVKITATLKDFEPGQVVTIYAKPYGGTKKPIASGPVNDVGTIRVSTKPEKQTVYSAKSEETAAWASSTSSNVTVHVRPKISAKMVGGYATSSGYRLYHYTSKCPQHHKACPISAFKMVPIHAGSKLFCELEIRVNGNWKTAATVTGKMNSKGVFAVKWIYGDKSVIGLPSRVHAEFGGDNDHESARSKFVYFKVTN
jgi:WD40 repeat protein